MSIQVPVDFEAKFDKALQEFDKFNSRVQKKVDVTGNAFGKLETLAKGFVAAFTVQKIIQGLEAVTQKASEAEEVQRKLKESLLATGSATNKNITAFGRLADELAQTSRFDDELILGQVGIAKQFGVTNKEAAKLLRVAVDLASATDGDLAGAVRNLGMTLDGTAGRMANQFPILQRLTAAQLRNGAAVELLGKMYEGAGARSLENYAGKQSKLGKAFDNTLEKIGLVITSNEAFLKSVDDLAEGTDAIGNSIARNETAISRWITRFYAAGSAISAFFGELIKHEGEGGLDIFRMSIQAYQNTMHGAVKINDLFSGSMDNLVKKFNPVTGKFEQVTSKLKDATKEMGAFNAVSGKTGAAFDESALKFDRFAADVKKDFEELEKKFRDIGKTEVDTITNEYKRNLVTIESARVRGYLNRKSEAEILGKIELKYAKDVAEYREKKAKEAEELAKKNFAEQTARIQTAYSNPIQSMVDQRYGEQNTGRISGANQQNIGQVAGIGKNLLGGKEGARNLLSAGVGAIASIWLGPMGAIIGELVGELSKGPEHVRAMMTEFFDSMPELIENLVMGVDEALMTFLEKWPEFLERMLDRLPDMVDRLIENLPRLIGALWKYIVKIGELFLIGILKMIWKLIEGAGKFVGKILEGAGKFVGKILEGAGRFIEELVKGAGKVFKNAFGGGGMSLGGGRNFDWTAGAGNILSGDTSEEGITNVLTGGLSSLFKGGARGKSGGQPMVVNLTIGNKQLAQAIVDARAMGFKL